MNLPWVSRSQYDEVVAAYRAAVEETRTPIRETFARFDSLLEKYHELAKRSNAEPSWLAPAIAASVSTNPEVQSSQKRSVIAQAIAEAAEGDERTARYLWKRAAELKAENKTPEEIAKELRRWESTEVAE